MSLIDKTETHPIQFCFKGLKLFVSRNGTYDNTNSSPTIGDVSYIEHRNNFRLPASHRLNLGVNFNKKTKHGMRTWNISLYNAYNAMNPAWVYRGHNKQGLSVIKKYTLLPLIPSFTYTYKF